MSKQLESCPRFADEPFYGDADIPNIEGSRMHNSPELELQTSLANKKPSSRQNEETEDSNQDDRSYLPRKNFNSKEVIKKKIMRYWLKKGKRITKKQIRYDCRQNLAKQRFRFQGRFITKAEME